MSRFNIFKDRIIAALPRLALATTLAVSIALSTNGISCSAQTSDQASAKVLAIKDLYKNCGASEEVVSSLQVTADLIERRLRLKLNETLSRDSSMTPAQAEERAKEDSGKIMKRFRELLSQRTSELTSDSEKIFTDVVSDNLKDDEVNYISNFYKTATGKKSIKVLPKSSASATQKMKEALDPYVMKLLDEAKSGTPAGECDVHMKVNISDVPADKQEKVKKLLAVSNFNTLMADTVRVQSQEQSEMQVKRIDADKTLSDEEKAQRSAVIKKFFQLLCTRINFAKVLEPYMVCEFSKDFSDEDLNNLIAYYEDPKAKSVQTKWASILKETIEKTNQVMDPKLQQLLTTAIEESIKTPKAQ